MVENISKEQYKIVKEIGSGSFGKVYKAEDMKSKQTYAIKKIKKQDLEYNEYLKEAFDKELECMKRCECGNSVRLIDYFQTQTHHNIVMELCDTDLEFILNKTPNGFSEDDVKIILRQLYNVFYVMDRENIIHRDLKLRNIMIKYLENTNISSNSYVNFVTKLSDFGFSKVMDEDITKTKLGTPATMAPEILNNKHYTKKADIWSLGVITYQLLFKTLPFRARNEKELMNLINNSKGFKIPDDKKISEALEDLLKNMLQVNPDYRLSWKQYFEHPFFNFKESINRFNMKYINQRKLSDSDENAKFIINKAKNKETGENVLIKQILREAVDSNPIYYAIYKREIELLKKLKSDIFIKYYEDYETSTHYYIVTEHFEGKILENFLRSRKFLSESLVQGIIRALVPAFKELDENNIILDIISTNSFCFKYFSNEENFMLKFYDYGLSSIFVEETSRMEYLLAEAKFGQVNSLKTNVLSMGMVIYKLLFGETIYQFKQDEDPEETIKKKKQIKLPKHITDDCKHLITMTCHQSKTRRYDWKGFLEDPYVKIRYSEDIRISPFNSMSDGNKNFFSDNKIENLAEHTKNKCQIIIDYYRKLILNKVELASYSGFYKEISIFIIFTILDIKMFKEFITTKERFSDEEEIHMIKINKEYYEYSSCNFFKSKIVINNENPIFDNYLKEFSKLENELITISKEILHIMDFDVDTMQSYDFLSSSVKNYFSGDIEKYFFKIFENGIVKYSVKDYKEGLQEFLISKFLYEWIIFIRIIYSNKLETINFFKIFECLENDCELNLNENNKNKNINHIIDNNLISFTFLGGVFKNFKSQNIIEEVNNNHKNYSTSSNEFIDSLILFYPEIVKMVVECSQLK